MLLVQFVEVCIAMLYYHLSHGLSAYLEFKILLELLFQGVYKRFSYLVDWMIYHPAQPAVPLLGFYEPEAVNGLNHHYYYATPAKGSPTLRTVVLRCDYNRSDSKYKFYLSCSESYGSTIIFNSRAIREFMA